jgi:hypothetical protein
MSNEKRVRVELFCGLTVERVGQHRGVAVGSGVGQIQEMAHYSSSARGGGPFA